MNSTKTGLFVIAAALVAINTNLVSGVEVCKDVSLGVIDDRVEQQLETVQCFAPPCYKRFCSRRCKIEHEIGACVYNENESEAIRKVEKCLSEAKHSIFIRQPEPLYPDVPAVQPTYPIHTIEPAYFEPAHIEPAHIEPAHIEPAHLDIHFLETPIDPMPEELQPNHVPSQEHNNGIVSTDFSHFTKPAVHIRPVELDVQSHSGDENLKNEVEDKHIGIETLDKKEAEEEHQGFFTTTITMVARIFRDMPKKVFGDYHATQDTAPQDVDQSSDDTVRQQPQIRLQRQRRAERNIKPKRPIDLNRSVLHRRGRHHIPAAKALQRLMDCLEEESINYDIRFNEIEIPCPFECQELIPSNTPVTHTAHPSTVLHRD